MSLFWAASLDDGDFPMRIAIRTMKRFLVSWSSASKRRCCTSMSIMCGKLFGRRFNQRTHCGSSSATCPIHPSAMSPELAFCPGFSGTSPSVASDCDWLKRTRTCATYCVRRALKNKLGISVAICLWIRRFSSLNSLAQRHFGRVFKMPPKFPTPQSKAS